MRAGSPRRDTIRSLSSSTCQVIAASEAGKGVSALIGDVPRLPNLCPANGRKWGTKNETYLGLERLVLLLDADVLRLHVIEDLQRLGLDHALALHLVAGLLHLLTEPADDGVKNEVAAESGEHPPPPQPNSGN